MYNEHSQEGHLFAGVLEYDTGVVRLAPKAIRSHYHSKVVHVHFSDCNVCRLSKNLRKTWEMRQSSAISRKTSLCICSLLCVFAECCEYLQEVDEVAQHQSVELRQRLHHADGCHRIIIVTDTLLVETHGDERLIQLTVPQLHQRGWGKTMV